MKVTVTKGGSPKDGAEVSLTDKDGKIMKKTTADGGIALHDNDGKKFVIDSEVTVVITAANCFATVEKKIKFELGDPTEKTEKFDLANEGKVKLSVILLYCI